MALTPMMQQYLQVKENCKDCILFFRLGDFYEMFFDDAKVAARELELVLTGRDCGLEHKAPMCGIPYHAASNYIGRLISKGFKVAICEQMEDPSLAKGIVKRDIIKIVTPGTFTDQSFLEENKNNYIMSLYIDSNDKMMGLCFADISTGEFDCTYSNFEVSTILDELSKYNPKELILEENSDNHLIDSIKERFDILCTMKSKAYFEEKAEENLSTQFSHFHEYKLNKNIIYSANGLLNYIMETQKIALSHINSLDYYNISSYQCIDINSKRNLELIENIRDNNKKGSLLWVLDKTNTAMGGRLLRKWIEQPLIDKRLIEDRLDAVEELLSKSGYHEDLKEALKSIYDIERIIGKISSKSVNAKELITLKNSIEKIPEIKKVLTNFDSALLKRVHEKLDDLKDIYEIIQKSILDNPSLSVKEGNIIKDGYNSDVDELRKAKSHGKEWIASLEVGERDATGIKSLKVGYNKVFGYYIEISNANMNLVPEGRYIRKQTLSNAERYITLELKEMEDKILGAEDKLISLEYELFVYIREEIEKQIERMKNTAKHISELDCLSSLSAVAIENQYSKPRLNEKGIIKIDEGRHPVIEKILPSGSFVSNSTNLDLDDEQLLLITGPNMAGKSTYMRQVALMVVMAQIGSFVPARSADISICDRIFTRIGASDDLSAGKSTFMVEMWEVSNILKNATKGSLILLDEVGRGTSTYDGLSIAWSVIEYICKADNIRCKTLFATHYHELTKLEGVIKGVKNYSVAVKEFENNIVFLRKIIPGGADQSYGIEVAKLAGLPAEVISRAKEILSDLEKGNRESDSEEQNRKDINEKRISPQGNKKSSSRESAVTLNESYMQLSLYDIELKQFIDDVKNIDIMNITPMEGFNRLYDLIKKAKNIN